MSGIARFGLLFMAVLFAYSASVQLDDIDWYFWLPLYTSASLISLLHTVAMTKATRRAAILTSLCGMILLVKVVVEAYQEHERNRLRALLSLDMEKRVVREKLGSSLVVLGMWLQLGMLGGNSVEPKRLPTVAMWLFIVASSGLCAAYFFPWQRNSQE